MKLLLLFHEVVLPAIGTHTYSHILSFRYLFQMISGGTQCMISTFNQMPWFALQSLILFHSMEFVFTCMTLIRNQSLVCLSLRMVVTSSLAILLRPRPQLLVNVARWDLQFNILILEDAKPWLTILILLKTLSWWCGWGFEPTASRLTDQWSCSWAILSIMSIMSLRRTLYHIILCWTQVTGIDINQTNQWASDSVY